MNDFSSHVLMTALMQLRGMHTCMRVQDNHPHAEVTVLELSPFYLQQGRQNFAEWSKLQDPKGLRPRTVFVQAAAEKMPAGDGTYDAVSKCCVVH